MALALTIDTMDLLPHTPASDVKKLGWRGLMKSVGRTGKVVVTNHNQPEAVILSAEAYGAITQALQQAADQAAEQADAPLNALRQRFDQRLAALQAADAGERLRAVVRGPAKLHGQVLAGTGH